MRSRSLALLVLAAMEALTGCIPQPATSHPATADAPGPARRRAEGTPSGEPQATRFTPDAALAEPAGRAAQPERGDETCDALCRAYATAVEATRYPRAAHISRELTALVPETPGLIWNQHGQILMSTWTHLAHFAAHRPGNVFKLASDSWWTAAPVMQDFCRASGRRGHALSVRIAQRLGMPATATNDGFVQVWIDPRDIFRPCPDPEIHDHECQVQIPMIPPYVRTEGEPPWACAGRQVSGSFVRVQDAHLAWMCETWRSSYGNPDPGRNYPWTALGYTYDWGQEDHRGPSEFVTLAGTMVVFHSRTPTDVYCAPAD